MVLRPNLLCSFLFCVNHLISAEETTSDVDGSDEEVWGEASSLYEGKIKRCPKSQEKTQDQQEGKPTFIQGCRCHVGGKRGRRREVRQRAGKQPHKMKKRIGGIVNKHVNRVIVKCLLWA